MKKVPPKKLDVKRTAAKKTLIPKAPDAAGVTPVTAEAPALQSAE